jgi:hypothetical protein
MSTRSALFIQTDEGPWLQHYCHYDGNPQHMLPALAKADPEAILRAKELRAVFDTGVIDGFTEARAPHQCQTPTVPHWAAHAYILTATGWKHARSDQEIQAILG